jgi:uncharacterized protein
MRAGTRAAPHTDLQRNILAFCRVLREQELHVSSAEVIDALRSARLIDLTDRDEFKLALRGILTSRPEDLPVYDLAFEQFWRTRPLEGGDDHFTTRERSKRGRGQQLPQSTQVDATPGPPLVDNVSAPVSSPIEVLTERDFASFEVDELAAIRRLIQALARRLATRASRRYQASRHGRRIDLRRTMRRSLQFGGTPVELSHKRQAIRKQRIVVICDVSRSMETYSTFLLQFIYAIQHAFGHVESFVFSTRLTRVTEYFRSSTIQLALDRMAHEVPDWAGGTRIGDNLKLFNDRYAPRGMTRGAVVVIASDGWERGDAGQLAAEMARLRRAAHAVVWVNPLAGDEDYSPLAQGMAAALPHVDHFLPGHNLRALEGLAEVLERLPLRRPRGASAPSGSGRR